MAQGAKLALERSKDAPSLSKAERRNSEDKDIMDVAGRKAEGVPARPPLFSLRN